MKCKLYQRFQNRLVKNEGNCAQISPFCVCGFHYGVMSLVQIENDTDSGQLISKCIHENGDLSCAGTAQDWEGTVGLV